MTDYVPIDYDALTDELLKYYLEPEYYQATKIPVECVVDRVTATTLDEYIKLLSEGHLNVEIREELDKYVDELLETNWFHKWPLVRWVYANRTLKRKTEVGYKGNKRNEENTDCEIEMLASLAKEGWPNAIADFSLQSYYLKTPENDYARCVSMWIHASRKGYMAAGRYLYVECIHDKYKKLCEELQLLVLEEAITWYLEDNGVTQENYREKLEGWPLEQAHKLRNQRDKLRKIISQKMLMRQTSGRLFWPEGESPYEIEY